MTVADKIAFGLKLRHTPKAEIKRRGGEQAEMLGLEPHLNRKPAALSCGQRQRVAMGRAPVAFPMEEPLPNLDAKLHVPCCWRPTLSASRSLQRLGAS